MAKIGNIYPPVINPLRKGRPLHYTPDQLAEKFVEYVQWCDEHPITISRTVTQTGSSPQGDSSFDREEVENKPQLVSIAGFLVWLGETEDWWRNLDRLEDGVEFITLKSYIRAYCQQNQAKLASSGVFKENIISRLLGLADKQSVDAKLDGTIEYEVKFGE